MNKSMVGRVPTKEDSGPGSVGRDECCGNPLRGCADCPPPKKLTFEEWWRDAQEWVPFEEHPEKAIWQAAQENK